MDYSELDHAIDNMEKTKSRDSSQNGNMHEGVGGRALPGNGVVVDVVVVADHHPDEDVRHLGALWSIMDRIRHVLEETGLYWIVGERSCTGYYTQTGLTGPMDEKMYIPEVESLP